MTENSDEQLLPFFYCNKIDTSKLSIRKKGSKYNFEYNGDPDIYIHLPEMRVPFNIQEKKTRDGRVFMKTISLSTEYLQYQQDEQEDNKTKLNTINNKHIRKFKQFINDVDNIVEEYFNENKSGVEPPHFYRSLYCSDNDKYSPTFSLNIRFNYGTTEPEVDVYDDADPPNIVEFQDYLFRNKVITGIIKLDSAWYSNGKIGLNWNAKQLQILDRNLVVPKQQSTLEFKIKN